MIFNTEKVIMIKKAARKSYSTVRMLASKQEAFI